MGVKPFFLGTSAREMFRHASHAVLVERGPLEAEHIGLDHFSRQVRIFPKGSAHARPARLGGQVGHGMQGFTDTHRQIFLTGNVCELAGECFIANGGKAKLLRPLRKGLRRHREDVVTKIMTRVRR